MIANTLRDLGDGLILRRSTAADANRLAEFNSKIHSDSGPDKPDARIAAWTHDLLTRPHPTFGEGDFTIVEDTASGQIVSSLNLIPQTWAYAGVPFGVGRPELVGTLPEYRNRGLVRAQFDVVHEWCAQRNLPVQAITGIPYYYRLFGYEMGLALGGGRAGFTPHIPQLPANSAEPYTIRPANENDLPLIAELYALGCQRSLIHCVWDEALWRYELLGKSAENVNRLELRIIENAASGEAAGFFAHNFFRWGGMLALRWFEVKPGVPWLAVTPTVIRYLQAAFADAIPEGEPQPFGAFGFWLGEEHPVYHIIPDRLPRVRKPYAFYLRVPDLPAFLRAIAPALEQRLAASPLAGYSGQIEITFYRRGVRMAFENGRLALAEAYTPTPVGEAGQAGFPDLTFLQLVFGYRSLEELKYAFADCWTNGDEAPALLEALFPRRASHLWPVA